MDKHQDSLNRLGAQLESWRELHSAPTPIPSEIWAKAGELVQHLGITRVSKALRLDYSRLKRIGLERETVGKLSKPCAVQDGPTFVEVRSVPTGGVGKCIIEVESARGSRMRIQMESPQCSSLVTLIREFAG